MRHATYLQLDQRDTDWAHIKSLGQKSTYRS